MPCTEQGDLLGEPLEAMAIILSAISGRRRAARSTGNSVGSSHCTMDR